MHDIYRTLDVIKTSLGLPSLDLNSDGQVELGLRDGLVAHLTRIDEEALEFSFRLPGLDFASPAMMRAMLGANLLGGSTDAGRLALDLDKDEAVYCERWIVSDLSETAIQRRFLAFVDTGVFWLTTGTDTLVSETRSVGLLPLSMADLAADQTSGAPDGAYMIRL